MKPFDRGLAADVQDDLDRLDAALDDRPDADAELRMLVGDVRAARPMLDDDARARIEARATRAVAAERSPSAINAARVRRGQRMRAVLAVATVAVVAVPVGAYVVQNGGSDDGAAVVMEASRGGSDDVEQTTQASGGVAESQSRGESGSSVERRSAAPDRASSRDRQVIRSAVQTVRVDEPEVADAAAQVGRIAAAQGGYVALSSVRESGPRAGGEFEVVVPSGRLDATLSALGALGTPVALERAAEDVTSQAASVADRLADLRPERAALRRQLAAAGTASERTNLRRELRRITSRIASLESEQRQLRQATAHDRLTFQLTTVDRAAADDDQDGGGWGIGAAWDDAGSVLQVLAGVLLIAAAILLPLALAVIVVVAGLGWLRSGRNNRTIEGA